VLVLELPCLAPYDREIVPGGVRLNHEKCGGVGRGIAPLPEKRELSYTAEYAFVDNPEQAATARHHTQTVIPAKAGIQDPRTKTVDSRLRGNDGLGGAEW